MKTWQELRDELNTRLGLRSEVREQLTYRVELNYFSPTGLVLFMVILNVLDDRWVVAGHGNLLYERETVKALHI